MGVKVVLTVTAADGGFFVFDGSSRDFSAEQIAFVPGYVLSEALPRITSEVERFLASRVVLVEGEYLSRSSVPFDYNA